MSQGGGPGQKKEGQITMKLTHARTFKTLTRVLGAGLVAAPLAVGALGQAHAATTPRLNPLTPSQAVSGYARTSNSVAISGNTAVVGSIGDNAAYIFVQTRSGWTQQARIADPDNNPNDLFGSAVAIHGNTILVGAPAQYATDCVGTPNQQTGAVFQFQRSGTTWTANGSIGCSYAGDKLGSAVAFDGSNAVLGAPGNQGNIGTAYILNNFAPLQWQQAQVLLAGDGQPGDQFGASVSISGSEAIVGAPGATISHKVGDQLIVNPLAGAAYAFDYTGQPIKSGMAWVLQNKLQAPLPTTGASFGSSVSVNGNLSLIGAPFDKNGAMVGAAYVSTLTPGVGWNFPVALPTPAGANQLGSAVALGAYRGKTKAVIGDYGAQATFIFDLSGSTWTQSATLTLSGALGLGSAVATDGKTAVIAAIYGNNYQGSAYATGISAL